MPEPTRRECNDAATDYQDVTEEVNKLLDRLVYNYQRGIATDPNDVANFIARIRAADRINIKNQLQPLVLDY